MKTRTLLAIVLLVFLAGSGIAACSSTAMLTEQVAGQPSTTAQVRRGDLVVRLGGSGEVAVEQIPAAFAIAGEISELNLAPGDSVQAGQVLARLDVRQAELELKATRLNWEKLAAPQAIASAEQRELELEQDLSAAQKALVELRAGPQVWYYQALLDQALADHAAIKQAYLQAVALSQTNLKTYQSVAVQLERQEEIAWQVVEAAQEDLAWAQNFTPDAHALLLAEARAELAAARLTAQQSYLNALRGIPLPTAEDEDLSGWNDELLALERARLAVDKAEWMVNQAALEAPIDGTVTQVLAVPGERVSAGEPVITLSALNAPLVRFYLEETDLAQLSTGDPLEIRLDAYPDQIFTGTILRIDPALVMVSGSPVIQVWGAVNAPPTAAWLDGMSAEVEVIAAEARDTLLIPLQALGWAQDGSNFVEVLQPDGSFAITPVVAGLQDLANVQILSGLQVGDQVKTAVR